MSKITKQAEFLDTLRTMITKEAGAVPTAKPGKKDKEGTGIESVSPATDKVDQNAVGADKNPQKVEQEKQTDPSTPVAKAAAEIAVATPPDTGAAKPATEAAPVSVKQEAAKENEPVKVEKNEKEEGKEKEAHTKLAEMGKQLLEAINTLTTKEASVPLAKPNAELKAESVSPKTDKVDKNAVGADKNPQTFEQHKATGPAVPVKKADEQEELDKQASFELGRQFCRTLLKSAQVKQAEAIKEAGARDFDAMIAKAAHELENKRKQEKQGAAMFDEVYAKEQMQKQAEANAEKAGSEAFYALMKQAQAEYEQEQTKQAIEQRFQALANEKLAFEKKAMEAEAKLMAKEAELKEKLEAEKRAHELQAWSDYTVSQIMSQLKRENA